jgi:hypothetical protein
MFKIDSIVWKYYGDATEINPKELFKIDSIVWKYCFWSDSKQYYFLTSRLIYAADIPNIILVNNCCV